MAEKKPTRQEAFSLLTQYKWKNKRFAAGVNRTVIDRGADMLGMDRTSLIHETIMGMRYVAEEIDLKGSV